MKNKFVRQVAIGLMAVMLGCASPVSTVVSNPMVITAEAATAKPKISKSKKTLYVGESFTLTVKNNKKAVKWFSSKKSVATVSKGKVTAKKAGKAKITAKVGKKSYHCTVTVKAKPASISEKKKTLEVGNSFELTLKNGGSGAKWSTSNKSVASIKKVSNTKYKITAKKKGTANIKVTYKGKTYTCKVTVKYAAKDQPYLNNTKLYTEVGDSLTVTLMNSTDKNGVPKWTISDKSIARIENNVSSDGVGCSIFPKKNGTATIKVVYEGETYTCKLTVKKIEAKMTTLSGDNKLKFGETITLKVEGLYGDVRWQTAGDSLADRKKDVFLKGNGNTCVISCGPCFGKRTSAKPIITKEIVASGSNGGQCRFEIEIVPIDISNNEVLKKLNESHVKVKVGETVKIDLGGMEKYLTSTNYDGIINEFLTVKDNLVVTGLKEGSSQTHYYIGGNLITFYIDVVK